jgi:peptidoglycan hydrolase-like protein with peptidoglycan-binding domain
VFGPATTAAVRAVQALFGIAQDGIVGPQTWSVLVTGSAP